jgi:hypothetical protein
VRELAVRRAWTTAALAALIVPLALVSPAAADTAGPPTVTKASIVGSSQIDVLTNGAPSPGGAALTALLDGTTVTLTVDGNPAPFFGFDARLCKPAVEIEQQSDFSPTSGGNCIGAPFAGGAADDQFKSASAAPANSTATTTFRVGTGSQPDAAGLGTTITCDATNPCTLWLKEAVPAGFNGGTAWVHYELRYAGAPGAPSPVTATGASTSAQVNWTAPADTGNAPLFDYVVTLTPQGGGAPVAQNVLAGTTTASFSGLTNFTTYDVSVIARNTAVDGTTHFSSVAGTDVVTPAPAGPMSLSGSPGNGQVDLSWVAPAGPAVDEYQIEVTPTNPPGAPTTIDTGSTATSRTVTGLTNGTVYSFRVRARYGASFGSYSNSVSLSPTGAALITQTITVRRPQGALVLTQVCGVGGTAPTFAGGPDPLFPDYPYPTDLAGEPIANYPTDCPIALGTAKLITTGTGAGQYFKATGSLNTVTVVDTRDTDPGWNANGQMGGFTAAAPSTGTFGGNQLGWDPIKISDTAGFTDGDGNTYDQLVSEGPVVAMTTPGAAGGLGDGELLATAPATDGLGIAVLDADLTLWIPIFAKTGNYTGVLTLTAV